MVVFLQLLIPTALVLVGIWLWWTFWFVPRRKQREWTAGPKKPHDPKARRCPVCDAQMDPGERVKSHVFPGKQVKSMRIFGCPECYPPNQSRRRVCPVCRKEVPRDGYLIARMFERTDRKHVHVLGCTGCRDARRPE
jgi:uncharacterized protein with PIN domain